MIDPKELEDAIKAGIGAAVKDCLSRSYNNPLEKCLDGIIQQHGEELRSLMIDAISSSLIDADFRDQVRAAIRHKLAKTLIERFGGELEKQVNVLKSDPATRARIVLAIEEIVKSKVA